MSTNVGNLTVGLGYDLSALEKGGADAFRTINTQTEGMSAQMKRASREGAESFRLIDEALGIHLSRPLTRILTQEFPSLAKGLQSILGVGVVGALGIAGVELFDKIAKGIEKAQKAQEALRAETENVNKTFAEEMAAYQNKDKAITASTAAVDRLAEAEMKQMKASQEASGWFNQTLAAVGDWLHKASSFQSTLNAEEIAGFLPKIKQKYDTLALEDSFKKTNEAAKFLAEEITLVSAAYAKLQQQAADAGAAIQHVTTATNPKLAGAGALDPGSGPSKQELENAKQLLDALTQIKKIQDISREGVREAEATKRRADALRDLESLQRTIGDSMRKLEPETDPLKKLADEIHQLRFKAQVDFDALKHDSDDALQLKAGRAALAGYEVALDRVLAKARADADVAKAMADLPTKIAASGAAPQLALPTALPTLGAGGTAGAQVDAFLKDQAAQLKLAAQAYQDIESPQQKYQVMQQELNILLQRGLIDQTAYTAALQAAQEQMAKSTDQLQKLLEKTGSASAGLQAFFIQLNDSANRNGTFTFDILNKGLQGFEDETVKALTGGKTSWMQYFSELDQMALKFLLNKEIQQLFQGMAGTSLGKSFGLDKLMGGGTASAAATQLSAGTIMQTAATMQLAAAQLMATGSAACAGGGGDWGSVSAVLSSAGVAGYASGTDFAPGGMSIVGENGPELLNLPTGASVTPAGRMGNSPIHVYVDARGAQMGVAEQIERSWAERGPAMVARAVAESSEIRKRSLS